MFKLGDKFDFELIKKTIKTILNDKKKRDRAVLIVLIVFILGIIVIKNDETSDIDISASNSETNSNEEIEESVSSTIYVDISGEVNNPGVYMVSQNTRLFQVIELAGGLTSNANIDSINQAENVYDGEKIIVPSKEDSSISSQSSSNQSTGKVSINKADLQTLQTLPGIGATKAQRIIDYRTKNGRFTSLEELKNVSGIGESTYEAIKDLICL